MSASSLIGSAPFERDHITECAAQLDPGSGLSPIQPTVHRTNLAKSPPVWSGPTSFLAGLGRLLRAQSVGERDRRTRSASTAPRQVEEQSKGLPSWCRCVTDAGRAPRGAPGHGQAQVHRLSCEPPQACTALTARAVGAALWRNISTVSTSGRAAKARTISANAAGCSAYATSPDPGNSTSSAPRIPSASRSAIGSSAADQEETPVAGEAVEDNRNPRGRLLSGGSLFISVPCAPATGPTALGKSSA